MTASRTPDLSEVLEGVRDTAAADVRVACVARVVRWSASKPREVDVQPVMKRAYTDEDGNRVADKQPVIPSVPLVYPGGGGFVVTWPMTVGDEVLLVFSDDSLDKYLNIGGAADIDPEDDRRHHLTDAVAIAGIGSLGKATSVSSTAVQIGTNGGTFQGAALGADLDTYLNGGVGSLYAWLVSVSSWAATVTPPFGGGSPPAPGTLESATVKVTP